MISIESSGDFKNMEDFLQRMSKMDMVNAMNQYGSAGVAALASATPVDSGLAAESWGYTIETTSDSYSITWINTDIESGFPVAIMLQYGHGTGTGGYVQGIDYINPAIRPIFDKIAESVWRVVTSA